MKKASIFRLLGACLLCMSVASHAAPDADDPLANLIQQKQAEHDAPDQAALDNLLKEKTTRNNPSNVAPNRTNPPAPRQAARPNVVANNHAAPPPSQRVNNRSDADELIGSAMGFLGVAYRFGGTSPTGFDCSGFMQYVFRKAFAVNLPRTSAEQATVGTYVNRSDLQPGDMVFFRTAGNRISHVGMYVGNDRFIHAPRTGKRIEITSLSNKYWNSKYATARRVKRNNAQNFIRN